MSEILQSLAIGLVQGITEFLPISSSAHLVLVPYIFSWDYQGLAFDVALHFGTVLALLIYFWRDWVTIISNGLRPRNANLKARSDNAKSDAPVNNNNSTIQQFNNYPNNLLWQIVLASIPAGIAGYFLDDYVESSLHSPVLLSFNLIFFGWVLWFADKHSSNKLRPENLTIKQSAFVGLAQALALIPGVSRSGISMAAGRSLGLNREAAARFSFLLGTPAMIGAFIFKFKDINTGDLNSTFWLAVSAAAIGGFAAIKYLLQYLQRSDFGIFFAYRIILASIILALYFLR